MNRKAAAGRTRDERAAGYLPLKPVPFHVLLTLAGGESHGYAIRQEVEARTAGAIRLWPTTLYGTLGQLEDEGLIEETAGRQGPADDVQRRFYRLTPLGRAVLSAETERLADLVRESRARQSGSRPREA
jgi:DNA-binding PadR family transcriptional regulator